MQEKKCNKCNEILGVSMFSLMKDGWRLGTCKKCRGIETLTFQRTMSGLASKMYSNQKQKSERRGHNPPSYSMIELRGFLLSSSVYANLYSKWVESGYLKELKPSCDRLDDYKGYSLDNIRIVTWGENNAKYQSDRVVGVNNKQNNAVVCLSSSMEFVAEYHSQKEACRVLGISNSNISLCCKKKTYTTKGFYWRSKQDYELEIASRK